MKEKTGDDRLSVFGLRPLPNAECRMPILSALCSLLSALLLFVNLAEAKPESPAPFFVYDGAAVGSRVIGMGEAGSAMAGEPYGILYNPATLGNMKRGYLTTSFELARVSAAERSALFSNEALRGKHFQFLALSAKPVGIFWRPLSSFSRKTVTSDKTEDLEISANQFGLTFSIPYTSRMNLGFNLSYLNGKQTQSVVTSTSASAILASGNGLGLDFGLLYNPDPNISISFSMRNALGWIHWNKFSRDRLPRVIRAGMTTTDPRKIATFSFDYEKIYYAKGGPSPSIFHFGLEEKLPGNVSVRQGAFGENLGSLKNLTLTTGIGYHHPRGWGLDFATKQFRHRAAGDAQVFVYSLTLLIPLNLPQTPSLK